MNKTINFLYSLLDFNRNSGDYDAHQRHAITTTFLLSGLYCVIAIFFLLFFGIQALLIGRETYGFILLGVAALTLLIYLVVWYLGFYQWHSHLVVGLCGMLCLFLYITGGDSGTGPIWYLVFPVLTLFTQGRSTGLISVAMLLVITLLITMTGIPGYSLYIYSSQFTQRIIAVYVVITILSYLFAYFRHQAEMRLAAIVGLRDSFSNIDKLSGLLNRRAMDEQFELLLEAYTRFQNPFTLVVVDIDDFKMINEKHGRLFGDYVIQLVAELLKNSLRKIDSAFRLEGDKFLLLLPGTHTPGAEKLVSRLIEKISQTSFVLDGQAAEVSFSFGVCEHKGTVVAEKTLNKVDELVFMAKKKQGNSVVSDDRAATFNP